MKPNVLSNIFANNSLKSRIAALLMALMLVCLTGCHSGDEKDNNSSQGSSEQSISSNTSSDEDTSSTHSEASSVVNTGSTQSTVSNGDSSKSTSSTAKDPADGSITVGENNKHTVNTETVEKIQDYVVNPAGLAYGYKGYADAEADALRNEILNTGNTEKYYDIKGTKYYVSSNGNDENDGLTPETPIKSLGAIDDFVLKEGDAVLFERGSVFRLQEQFNPEEGILYGSYGEGRKPMFLGSPENFAEAVWQPSNKKNVWYINYLYAGACGAFFDQGKEIGYLRYNMRGLTKNTDYYTDSENARLYLYCDKGNPSDVWDYIEFTQEGCYFKILAGVDDCTFDNLCIRYTSNGIQANYNNKNLVATNCEVGFSGGQVNTTTNRSGNAIHHWYGGPGLVSNHNWIYQTFDSGVSPQGNGGPALYYDNISICDNLFEYNNADIEFWDTGTSAANTSGKGTAFENFKMENNIMRFTALGWGTRADDGGIRGIEGVIYGHADNNKLINVTFENNIIDCPGRKIFDFKLNTMDQYNGFTRRNNTIYVKNSMRTSDMIIRGITLATTGVLSYGSNKKNEVIEYLHMFDPTAKVYWYE